MEFDKAILSELRGNASEEEYRKAHAYYQEKKAESNLRSLLKYKYGKVLKDLTKEQIFQFEGSGNRVLTLRYKNSKEFTYVVLQPNQDGLSEIKREIKKLGFKIRLFN